MAKTIANEVQEHIPLTGGGRKMTPLGANEGDGAKLPRWGERLNPFFLGHGKDWELVETGDGWRLLPVLKRLILSPGVNWTHTPSAGQGMDPSDLEAKARQRLGMQVFPDVEEYRIRLPGHGGKIGYFLRWESPTVYDDGAWEPSFDADGYHSWRWSLVTDRRVEMPRESIIAAIRARATKARQRALRTPHLEEAKAAAALADARLKGLADALKVIATVSKRPLVISDGAQ